MQRSLRSVPARAAIALAVALLGAPAAQAAQATSTFTVTATVTSGCTVSAALPRRGAEPAVRRHRLGPHDLGSTIASIRNEPRGSHVQALARGALGFIDGSRFASARIDDSFVLVRTPGHADAGGTLVVARSRSHHAVPVAIDSTALPPELAIDRDEISAIAPRRAGAMARAFVWGDGSGGTSIVTGSVTPMVILVPATAAHFIHARVPASQSPPVGSYADTITVTIDY